MSTINYINTNSNNISDHGTSERTGEESSINYELPRPTFFSTLKEYLYSLYIKFISPYFIRLPTVNGSDMECMSTNVLDYHTSSNDVEVAHSAPTSSPSLLASGLYRRPGVFSKTNFSDSMLQPIKARSRSESEGLNKFDFMKLCQNNFLDEIEVKKSCLRCPYKNIDNCDCNDDSDSAASSGISSSEEQSLSDLDYGTPTDFNPSITEDEIISRLKELDNNSSSSSIATILAQNSNTASSSPSINHNISPTSDKKCVKFADEMGKELYTVRVMKEPSDYPPRLSPSIVRRYRSNNDDSDEFYDSDNSDSEKSKASWTLNFKQPASEYVKFRESLDSNKVALENVVLKNNCHKMTGTIKVVNLSFEKNVFLRLTTDKWKTFKDIYAKYQPSNSKIYDTFCFETEIPKDEHKDDTIEFCICYETNNQQFWDSNNGDNYHLVTEESKYNSFLQPLANNCNSRNTNIILSKNYSPPSSKKYDYKPSTLSHQDSSEDAYNMKQSNWTHFAAWKNLTNERPYW